MKSSRVEGYNEDGGQRQESGVSREYLWEGRESSGTDQYNNKERTAWVYPGQ